MQPAKPLSLPYTEAQATAWLCWLARGMKANGQTIFLIEQLQPGWLDTSLQRQIYLLASRMSWGIGAGLLVGIIMADGLMGALISTLLGGLVGVLATWLIKLGNKQSSTEHSHPSPTDQSTMWDILGSGLRTGRISGLLFGLLFGLVFGLNGGLRSVLNVGVSSGMLFAMIFGSIWLTRDIERDSHSEIRTVEMVRFSRAHFPQGFKNGFALGQSLGLLWGLLIALAGISLGETKGGLLALIVGLSVVLIGGVWFALIIGMVFGLMFGLSLGVIVGLMTCFRPTIGMLKAVPNQGISLSLRNAALMGAVGGGTLALLLALLAKAGQRVEQYPVGENTTLVVHLGLEGVEYGAIGSLGSLMALCIFMWYGGFDVIQHYIVRSLLYFAGSIPWNYARFLDYAAEELHFLQKVGGGYIFVHRYLLEHFAEMEESTDISQKSSHTHPLA